MNENYLRARYDNYGRGYVGEDEEMAGSCGQHQACRTISDSIVDENKPAPYAIIYQSEIDYISKCILDYPNIETGGQLFGFLTEYGAPVVCYALGPGPRANHQPAFFNQDTTYLQSVYNELSSVYGLRYIGEWHSHHQLGLARPSGHDASSVVNGIVRNRFRHFLLCIGNCDNMYRSTLNAFTFHINNPYNYKHVPWSIVGMESPYRSLVDGRLGAMLRHPVTMSANHGANYVVGGGAVVTSKVPDYADEYWLNNKANNLVLKQIIDYIANDGSNVSPQLDEQKNVHLLVGSNEEYDIIFGAGFPNAAPMVVIGSGVNVGQQLTWNYNGDIFESFKDYYSQLKLYGNAAAGTCDNEQTF